MQYLIPNSFVAAAQRNQSKNQHRDYFIARELIIAATNLLILTANLIIKATYFNLAMGTILAAAAVIISPST